MKIGNSILLLIIIRMILKSMKNLIMNSMENIERKGL